MPSEKQKPNRPLNDRRHMRGFASLSMERRRELASMGGKAAHAKGTAHEFTSEEATAAGKMGGRAAHAKGTAHEFTSKEAKAAGAKSRSGVKTYG